MLDDETHGEAAIFEDLEQHQIVVILSGSDIVEYEGELQPSIRMSPQEARQVAMALLAAAEGVEDGSEKE